MDTGNNGHSAEEIQFEKDLGQLCELIESGMVIPIVGFGLYDNFYWNLAKLYDSDLCVDILREKPGIDGFQLINAVYHRLDNRSKVLFSKNINDKINSGLNDVTNCISPAYEKLARIKKFKAYINATFLNTLPKAVKLFKNSEIDVVSYHPRTPEDIKYNRSKENSLLELDEIFEKPLVYNLLGLNETKEYVLTDADFMELIVKMLTNESGKFSNLNALLQDAVLLFIGCNFPDWILRMFLRIACGTRLDKVKLEKNYIVEQVMDEPNKTFFLTNYGVTRLNVSPCTLVDRIFATLLKGGDKNIESPVYKHHAFISYNHADKEMAQAVNEQLKENGIKTWFDEAGLFNGDELDDVIRHAIDNALVFIPIVTNNANANPEGRKYFKKEWNYAVKRNRQNIYPVRMKDYTGHSLNDSMFEKDTVECLLAGDGKFLLERQIVEPDRYLLTDDFIRKIKKMFYDSI